MVDKFKQRAAVERAGSLVLISRTDPKNLTWVFPLIADNANVWRNRYYYQDYRVYNVEAAAFLGPLRYIAAMILRFQFVYHASIVPRWEHP